MTVKFQAIPRKTISIWNSGNKLLKMIVDPGYSSAWLERLVRDQEVAGSNPVTPTLPLCHQAFAFRII